MCTGTLCRRYQHTNLMSLVKNLIYTKKIDKTASIRNLPNPQTHKILMILKLCFSNSFTTHGCILPYTRTRIPASLSSSFLLPFLLSLFNFDSLATSYTPFLKSQTNISPGPSSNIFLIDFWYSITVQPPKLYVSISFLYLLI